jgi:HCOMODA/2-hydroxy-3-carboxy-muconic semialdehyde decarboxylase
MADDGRENGASRQRQDFLHVTRHDLVAANRILAHHKVVDAFGHVSARHPLDPDRFLLARRMAPALVAVEDLREFTLDGELVTADGTPVFLERFIHGAIYAARPDVTSVVHSHSPGAIAFSTVNGQTLKPICHTCGFLGTEVPIFEIRDVAGDATDLLIRDFALAGALAATLGDAAVVLMRGHGSTAVGRSIGQAVYRAIYTETNASIQITAAQLGIVTYLNADEAEAAEATAALQVERCWETWKSEVDLASPR